MTQNSIQISDTQATPPKGLVPFRKFAAALAEFSDFDAFRESLSRVVMEDSGYAGILELDADVGSIADSEVGDIFAMDSLVVPLGHSDEKGFIRYMGKGNGRPFSAEDLMWVGAITEFVSLAYANARVHHKALEKGRVFQFLINQLPLGVVCFDTQGEMLVGNKLARRLLGDEGVELIRGALCQETLKEEGKLSMHLEVEGRLLYAEGRRLDVDDGLSVYAFVMHDMSGQREKHMLKLERSVFLAQSRHKPLTIAVIKDSTEAGALLRSLKANAESLQLEVGAILALDAYTCACIFTGEHLRSVRSILKSRLPESLDHRSIHGALIADLSELDETSPAQSLIDAAHQSMRPLELLLKPSLLVLDAYPAVLESLEWICGEVANFESINHATKAVEWLNSGRFDGVFVDIDAFGKDWLNLASEEVGGDLHVFYISHKQPSMIRAEYGLGEDAIVLQKPFDAKELLEMLGGSLIMLELYSAYFIERGYLAPIRT